ncbi:MAG: alpha/beta hydrolase [Anaerolineae bacterium]
MAKTAPRRLNKLVVAMLAAAALLLLMILLCGAGAGLYARQSTYGPQPEALAALESSAEVTVTTEPWLVFSPTGASPATGLIIYPGGLVDPRAYAPPAHALAAQGYLVVVTPVPLNLAVLAPNRAGEVIAAFPQIEHWAIGGHSLGGTMAAQFAANQPQQVDGLVLWASYPAGGASLADSTLPVASVFGTRDGLISSADIENSRLLLPATARFVPVEGGNHAQFGWYGPQQGDQPATISHTEQMAQQVDAALSLLEQLR